MLKNFHRVDVLRKYFNTKILQHSACNSVLVIGFHAARPRKERQSRGKKRIEKATAMEEIFEFEASSIWEAAVGEFLVCDREPENASYQYAVAVKKEGTTLPCEYGFV